MTYSEKLQSPLWRKKRIEILNRDQFICRDCKADETELHVHHLSYTRNTDPWDYPNKNFITLCGPCHAAVTREKNELRLTLDKYCIYPSQMRIATKLINGVFSSSPAVISNIIKLLSDGRE